MPAKKETLIAGIFSHKNIGQLVKQQKQQMMKNVDVTEGCNFIKYQLTEFQLVFYSQMNLTSVHSKHKQSSQASMNISKKMDTRSTQVTCSFKDATTSPIKFW
jgi:hypothetical protein